MKKTIIFILTLCCASPYAAAQTSICAVLQQIAQHNLALKAGEQAIEAEKVAIKAENNLQDPEVEYIYQYGKQGLSNEQELNITQSFNFPTTYAARNRYAQKQHAVLNLAFERERCELLHEAKEACLAWIYRYELLKLHQQRQQMAQTIVELYEKRLALGDANIIELNKAKLEHQLANQLVMDGEQALDEVLQHLIALNGNHLLRLFDLTYPTTAPLPSWNQLQTLLLSADHSLQQAIAAEKSAQGALHVAREGWLPQLQVGYRRSGSVGEMAQGFIVGASLPLFANRGKTKQARLELLHSKWEEADLALQVETAYHLLYNEATQLQRAIAASDPSLVQQTIDYLSEALQEGEITLLTFFNEMTTLYESQTQYITLHYRYHLALSALYKCLPTTDEP